MSEAIPGLPIFRCRCGAVVPIIDTWLVLASGSRSYCSRDCAQTFDDYGADAKKAVVCDECGAVDHFDRCSKAWR